MPFKILFFCIIFLETLFGDVLNKDYYIDSNDINLSQIVQSPTVDTVLFSLQDGKYTKRIKAKDLIQNLITLGYHGYTSQSNYIKFTKKSPIDTTKIKDYIENFYIKEYPSIHIEKIVVMPRSYIESFEDEYTPNLQVKNSLLNHGTLYIKTNQQKKIFFDYTIDAKIDVYIAKNNIKKDTELSPLNCIKKSIILDKLKAMPLEHLPDHALQSKTNIRSGSILTTKDIRKLYLIKRGSYVNTTLNERGMVISFSAKAENNGKLGAIITVQTDDGKKLKVRVTGKNMAEVQ